MRATRNVASVNRSVAHCAAFQNSESPPALNDFFRQHAAIRSASTKARLLSAVPMVAALAALGLAACGSEQPDAREVTEARCTELRDRYIELRLDGSRTPPDQRDGHRKALVAALGADFVATCISFTTDDEINCVMKAADNAAATACTPVVTP